jgi:hypothetical protein
MMGAPSDAMLVRGRPDDEAVRDRAAWVGAGAADG